MNNPSGMVIESVGSSVAFKTTFVGALTGVAGFLSQINWIGLSGVLLAVLGLLVNVYFLSRRDRREAAESAARIKALQGEPES